MKAFRTMLKTELKLSLRGMDMVIFAIAMPLVITIILGILYGEKPAYEGANYTFFTQSFAAMPSISICAGGVMGLPLVISDYRGKRILKRFQVTPVNPSMILAVQLVIYTLYSLISFLSTYVTAYIFFGYRMEGSWGVFLAGYLLVLISIFSIGMMVGGIAPNAKIASIFASLLYFPMLIFSGATLPYEIMPTRLQKVADIMPLTQGIKLLKSASLGLSTDNVLIPLLFLITIALICITVSIRYFRWE